VSDFIAEAQVLIRPNTVEFRKQLEIQLLAATKGITVPIPVTAVGAANTTQITKAATSAKQTEATVNRLLEKSELALAAAQEKALLATTQLGAARARLAGAVSAVTAAEQGLAAAERSKNAILIESAEATLTSAQAEEVRARTVARTIVLANAEAAALRVSTAATEKAAASQIAGAQRARVTAVAASGATADLAAVQRAAATGADVLARSQLLVANAGSAVARAQIAATAGIRQLQVAQQGLAAALRTGNIALIQAAANTLVLSRANQELTASELAAARAANVEAAALDRQAASHALAARGAGATALAMAGARGATLAASSSFLIGAASAVFFASSIREAIDAEDTFRRTTFLLGDELANQLASGAIDIGKAFAIDDDDVLKFETQIAKVLIGVGLATDRTAELSEGIVRLGADMAAFNRVPVEDALKALQAGLAGNARGLRPFGVLLDNASVKQKALAQTGKESADSLTNQELVLARYALILERAAFQTGAFADQKGSLTTASQRLSVNFKELQERVGKGLIPVVGGLVDALNDSFDAFNLAADGAGDLAGRIPLLNQAADSDRVRSFVGEWGKFAITSIALGPAIAGVTTAMDIFGDETEDTTNKLTVFDKIAGQIAGQLGRVANAFDKVVAGLPSQQQRSDLSLTLAQAAGDQGAELAELRAREQRQAAFLERLLREPALTTKQIELQRKAAAQLDQTRDQINAILEEQASNAEKAATDARAAQARTQQAFLEMLGGQQARARNLILRAAGTESLKDDIRFNKEFRELLLKQIEQVRETVTDAQRRASELRSLTALLIQVGAEIRDLRKQQREAQREAVEAQLERAQTGTQLDIELADINENTRRRVALRLKLIQQLLKERRVLKLTGNALKENRNEIARIRKEIEEITKEQEEAGKAAGKSAQQFFFEQLQAQQGFASNLLGNLITGPTAGLVGVPSPAGAPPPGRQVDAAAKAASGRAGPTSGQANTTNTLLERILDQLRHLNGEQDHPEATHQRRVGRGSMDNQAM
jgi:hypothetical protein